MLHQGSFLLTEVSVFRKLTVVLSVRERVALDQLARLSLRAPDDQLRWLLRQELLRRGLIEGSAMDDEHENPARRAPSEVEP